MTILDRAIHFRHVQIGVYIFHHLVQDRYQSSRAHGLCLIHTCHQHFPLTLCTAKVIANIADTAICGCLQTAQCLHTGMRNLYNVFVQRIIFIFYEHASLIVVQMVDFVIVHVNVYAAQLVNGLDQRIKAHCHIFCDIQVKVHIQHVDRLFRTALCICRIRFIVAVRSEI